ncbi:autism susceptibility gene 2 protein-like isoform X3 [Mercenaria mercenaria]|uniref:autism susceptibility gene 2 protein-like isoform X3 n=1 Tax=Mercenaria mercenaria TaxID=6596 RepID=UPI00234F9AB3|nr:autism susceptibility gene 2 protein-like isoform X3 [Mercenaria mercenaria]
MEETCVKKDLKANENAVTDSLENETAENILKCKMIKTEKLEEQKIADDKEDEATKVDNVIDKFDKPKTKDKNTSCKTNGKKQTYANRKEAEMTVNEVANNVIIKEQGDAGNKAKESVKCNSAETPKNGDDVIDSGLDIEVQGHNESVVKVKENGQGQLDGGSFTNITRSSEQRDKKWLELLKTPTNLSKSKKHNNSAADSESSGETTDHLDTSNLILNGPKKTISRRFSDVSTRSSSGAGYLCDSESGDERASDASLDIFKPVNNSITCERNIASPLPPVSTHSATITTATHTTTGSDVTATIVTTTTSCISLVTSSLTTTSANVTTAHHIVNTTSSSQHLHHHNHHQQNVHQSCHKVTSVENKFTTVQNKYSSVDNKYSTQSNQQKIHNNNNNITKDHTSHTNNFQSVIKRRQLSPPPLTKSSRLPSPPRHKPVSHQLLPASTTSTSVPSVISNPVINRESSRPTPPSRSKTPRREDSREREAYQQLPPSLAVSKSFFSPGYPGHGPSTGSLYSPLGPSPGLHPIHSTPSHTPTFPGSSAIPSLHQHPSTPQPHPNMFAPPLPLGLPGGPIPGSLSAAPSSHIPAESPLSISNPDLLREELNRRFLASQDRSSLLGSIPPLMRADIHQHMHQHQHQHMHQHQHTYGGMPPPPISAPSIVPTPTPSPFDKVPNNPFFRQGIPGLPGYPSPLPDALHSGIPGAFQPKGIATLHPAVGPLFIGPGRELEKSPAHIPSAPQQNLPTTAKKPGKWCAVHVRIAWEIYHHQQKQNSDKGSDSKPSDPLRPPSHLIQGPTLARPTDLPNSASSSLMGSGRGLFDSNPHSLLNSASHLASSFPRPSPYSIGSSLPLGIGNGLPSTSREGPHSVPSGSQDWGRIHRPSSSSTFSSPWTKTEDREKEEREHSLDRRREEDRERERRLLEQDRHRFNSLDERSRDRDRFRESEMLAKSRSRSRSPMRNGRADSVKSERSFERRSEDSNIMKVKEERRESLTREDDLMAAAAAERERLLKNEYLANSIRTGDAFLQGSVMDRARMLNPALAYSVTDRVPPHPSLWNPFDKGPVDFQNIRQNLQREMEQAREQLLLNRFPGPGLQPGFPGLSPFEQERLRDEMILRETQKRERDYLERLPAFTRERMFYENSKIQGIRPQDHLHPSLSNSFSRSSPALHNHIKRSSPAMLPGAPPPLIHSVSTHGSRGHNSPAVNKTKGVSPTDSVGESKRDSNSNSTDPDAHSR